MNLNDFFFFTLPHFKSHRNYVLVTQKIVSFSFVISIKTPIYWLHNFHSDKYLCEKNGCVTAGRCDFVRNQNQNVGKYSVHFFGTHYFQFADRADAISSAIYICATTTQEHRDSCMLCAHECVCLCVRISYWPPSACSTNIQFMLNNFGSTVFVHCTIAIANSIQITNVNQLKKGN